MSSLLSESDRCWVTFQTMGCFDIGYFPTIPIKRLLKTQNKAILLLRGCLILKKASKINHMKKIHRKLLLRSCKKQLFINKIFENFK